MKKIKFVDDKPEDELMSTIELISMPRQELTLREIHNNSNFIYFKNILLKYVSLDNEYFFYLICQYLSEVQDVVISASNEYGFNDDGVSIEVSNLHSAFPISMYTGHYMDMNMIDNHVCAKPVGNLGLSYTHEFLIDVGSTLKAELFLNKYSSGYQNKDYYDRITLCLMELKDSMEKYPITLKGKKVYNVITGKKEIKLSNGEMLKTYRKSKEFGWKMFTTYCEDNLGLIEIHFPEYKVYNREISINKLVKKEDKK